MDFEFFAIIQTTSLDKQSMPEKFASLREVDDREPCVLKLREVDDEPRNLWDVEAVFEEGRIFLRRGWARFARSYSLNFGHFLAFTNNGADELTVKVFYATMFRRHYHYENHNPDICPDKFFVLIPETSSLNKLSLPNRFAEMLDIPVPNELKLREVDGEPRNLWDVEVLSEGDGRIYLRRGWERFVHSYSLQVGYLLVFNYDGANLLTFKVFDWSMCRMHYCYDATSDSVLDNFCVFPNRVHLNEGQKAVLNEFCAENKPKTPFYICRMQMAHLADFKGKMCFNEEYTNNYLRRLTKKATYVNVSYNGNMDDVRMKIGQGGKQAIMTSMWLSVTRGLNFEVGDLAMFWF